MNSESTSMRSITSDHKQTSDFLALQKLQDFLLIKSSSGRTQNGSTFMVDISNKIRSQFDWLVIVKIPKSSESTLDSPNFSVYTVCRMEGIHYCTKNIIQSWAQSSASNNRS